jgi:hypothetical protein
MMSTSHPSCSQYIGIYPQTIVPLDPGNKFIVVILPVSKNSTDLGRKVLPMYCKTFKNIAEQTLSNIHPADRPNVVSDWMASHHFLPRDGQIAMEFLVRVRNYADDIYLHQTILTAPPLHSIGIKVQALTLPFTDTQISFLYFFN